MQDMHRLKALWTKIVGFLLILLGFMLFVSPYVHYSTEKTSGTQSSK